MKRFLSTLERDLERSLGPAEKPPRLKPTRTKATADQVAQQVVGALRSGGIEASRAEVLGGAGTTQRCD